MPHAASPGPEGEPRCNDRSRSGSEPAAALRALSSDARGASFVEYLVLVGTVALATLIGFRFFGAKTAEVARRNAACVDALGGGCTAPQPSTAAPNTTADSRAAQDGAPAPSRGTRYWVVGIPRGFVMTGAHLVRDLATLAWAASPPGGLYYTLAHKPNPAEQTVKTALVVAATCSSGPMGAASPSCPIGPMAYEGYRAVSQKWKQDPAYVVGGGALHAVTIAGPFAVKYVADAAALADVARAAEIGDAARAADAAEAANEARATEEIATGAAAARTGSLGSEIAEKGMERTLRDAYAEAGVGVPDNGQLVMDFRPDADIVQLHFSIATGRTLATGVAEKTASAINLSSEDIAQLSNQQVVERIRDAADAARARFAPPPAVVPPAVE